MFQTAVANLVADFNRKLCANGARYVLIYADTDPLGCMNLRCSSNYEHEQIGPLLGAMLEAGEKVKLMLADLLKARPLLMPAPVVVSTAEVEAGACPGCGAAWNGRDVHQCPTPAFVEVPTEQAVQMLLDALMTNLQLRGGKPSAIIQPG